MAALYETPQGALSAPADGISDADKRKLQAAKVKASVAQAAGGNAFTPGALSTTPASVGGGAYGPPQSLSGPVKDFAKQSLMGVAGGFGFGPLSAVNLGNYAIHPETFTDTSLANVPGLPNSVAFSPGPIGPMLDMTGFGGIVRAAGALNQANLNRISATDPDAVGFGGPGWGGFFSHGTYSGTLPGGLEAATRRAMIHQMAMQAQAANRRDHQFGGGLGPNSRGNIAAGQDEANSNAG